MSDEQRGLDSTMTPATLKEKKRCDGAVQEYLAEEYLAEMKAGLRNSTPCRPLPGAEDPSYPHRLSKGNRSHNPPSIYASLVIVWARHARVLGV